MYIRKIYKNGGNITDVIENQEPFNFKSYAPILKISTIVVTLDTPPEEPECENARLNMRQNYYCTAREKSLLHEFVESIQILTWAMHNIPTA